MGALQKKQMGALQKTGTRNLQSSPKQEPLLFPPPVTSYLHSADWIQLLSSVVCFITKFRTQGSNTQKSLKYIKLNQPIDTGRKPPEQNATMFLFSHSKLQSHLLRLQLH